MHIPCNPVVRILAPALLLLGGCDGHEPPRPVPNGDAESGARLIGFYGCGSCHAIPGIRNARGVAGPPLDFWSRRGLIVGKLPNNPDNLVVWIANPQAIEPETAMPDLGVSEAEARDIAAYLFTLE